MKELSFILPVRIESEDRLFNLQTCLKFLKKNFPESEIVLTEHDVQSKIPESIDLCGAHHIFNKSGNVFMKTHAINTGILSCTRTVVAITDIDCLIDPDAIRKAVKRILRNKYSIILPHNEIFVNIKNNKRDELRNNQDLSKIPFFKRAKITGDTDLQTYNIPSGYVLYNRELLIKIGGFNKNISYVWEDIEILKRARKLGIYYYSFHHNNIIHLDHYRKYNDYVNLQNEKEYRKIIGMRKRELTQYIRNNLSISNQVITRREVLTIRMMNLLMFSYLRFLFNRIIIKYYKITF